MCEQCAWCKSDLRRHYWVCVCVWKGILGWIQRVLLILSDLINLIGPKSTDYTMIILKTTFLEVKTLCCLMPAYRLICSAHWGFTPWSDGGLALLHAPGNLFFQICPRLSLSCLLYVARRELPFTTTGCGIWCHKVMGRDNTDNAGLFVCVFFVLFLFPAFLIKKGNLLWPVQIR